MQVNITKLIDDVQCYQTVRELRWPDGVACPSCESKEVIKRGFDDTEPARQRYECHNCDQRFDDLTDTIFAGHHQPLKVWILCLYFMGLNLSNAFSALWADSSHLCARRFPNGVLTLPGLPTLAVSGPLSHPRPLQRLRGFLGMDHTAHA